MGLALLVLLLTTLNLLIAFYAALCICCVETSILCIAQLIGWEMGTAMSVAVIVIIGLSVDFIVHIANHYVTSPYKHRKQRTQQALLEMGVSIFSGAVTTILSTFPLFFASLLFFSNVALLVILAMLFSLLFSFGLFTALCHAIGPNGTFADLNYWIVQPVWNLMK